MLDTTMTRTLVNEKVAGLRVRVIEDYNQPTDYGHMYLLSVKAGKEEVFGYWSINEGHILQIAWLILTVAARCGKGETLRVLNDIILRPHLEPTPIVRNPFWVRLLTAIVGG